MGNKSSTTAEQTPADTNEADEQAQEPEQLSYWQMIKQGYQELVNAIIRPPRCQYTVANLGPTVFDFCGKKFQRIDFELRNPRGLKLVCSIWEPTPQFRPNPVLPCLIYMHGNSSARLEALPQLSLVLSLGATLLSFDFSGSGQSEGEYVSLGAFEKEDLQCVIEYLRSTGTTSTIALWGRSMGAATSLLHGERDPSIAGMVLDSSFADLTMLAEEMVEKGRQHGLFAPNFIVKIAIRFIRSTILKTADFDIKTLSPIEHADKCYIPALFVAAEGDAFVPPHHSQKIYHKYAGDKNVIIVDGDHNSPRPKFMFDSAAIFLTNVLQIPDTWIIPDGQKYAGIIPWNIRRAKGSSAPAPPQSASGPRPPPGPPGPTSLDEALAMSLANGDLEGAQIGMTEDRQADVQAKLYRMLGDRSALSAGSASSSSSAAAAASSSSSLPPPPPEKVGGSSSSSSSSSSLPPAAPMSEDMATLAYQHVSVAQGVSNLEWVCLTCTLFNLPGLESCAACGMPRPDLL